MTQIILALIISALIVIGFVAARRGGYWWITAAAAWVLALAGAADFVAIMIAFLVDPRPFL
ncbi:hypothetical protein ACFORJ_06060 [Corynebacterium hansenii]|uniref:Uncharacterized protein n=1 Tax=Corynebacterium hansenii TaxID=394964 RepID=A0ABV7ZR47_9CORY|nr:hypothetical protein [Corynebacterium hansenii]WJZ00309.1 hypothetical protein CHAN_08500 [Corynebacterium hansenii]